MVHDDVEIAHQHQGDGDLVPDGPQLVEEQLERHAVLQRHRSGALNDGPVGQRVAEWDAHLDHVNAPPLQREDDIGRHVQPGTAGAEVKREQLAVAALREKSVDAVHLLG